MAETSYRMGRAVVIGASLAGLLAARVLSKHFDQVTVLDRDTLPEAPEVADARRGVPHGRHVHVLLIRGQQAMIVAARPPNTRGGLIFPIEGNRWLVTLVGALGDHPPTSHDGFLDFARSLPVPDVHEAICGARPLTDAQGFGFPATFRRRYEQLERFPSGLLVMGDALCSFNPVYGQGMTTSALEAGVLDKCLSRLVSRGMLGIQTLTEDFRRRAADVVEAPWQLASAEDLRFPQTAGLRPATLRLLHWYTEKVHEAAGRSPLIAKKFISVVHMMAPPSGLFGWDVIRELLRVARGKRSAGSQPAALAPESPYG